MVPPIVYAVVFAVSTCLLLDNFNRIEPLARPDGAANLTGVVWATIFFTSIRQLYYPIFIGFFTRKGLGDYTKGIKFAQQLLNFLFHTCSSVYLMYGLPGRDWFETDAKLWAEYPDQKQDYRDIVPYIMQLGYHTNCLAIHFTEPRREDHLVMLVHHAATVFLIASSFFGNYIRIGLIVMMYHDTSDILGCLIKMTNYLGWKKTTLVIFPNMCLVWFVTRLYMFPKLCLTTAVWIKPFSLTQYLSFPCMFCLCCLHAYWFYLFMQMGLRAIKSKGANTKDLSEDKASPIVLPKKNM